MVPRAVRSPLSALAVVLLAVPALAGCLAALDAGPTDDDGTGGATADAARHALRCFEEGAATLLGAPTAEESMAARDDAARDGDDATGAGTDGDAGSDDAHSCNLLTTLEETRQGNEVTIAVNPADPDNVAAGAKDYYPPSAGQCVWDGLYHTTDGASWSSQSLPGSPWLLLNDPDAFQAYSISQYWCATDPVMAFGPDGTLYYSLLAYQGDPVTGSKAGKDVTCALHEEVDDVPCSGVNDVAFNRVAIAVGISTDGGATMDEFSTVASGTFPLTFHDRNWLAVDQESGTLYIVWTTFFVGGSEVYRSTDGGQTWEGPVLLDEVPIAGFGDGPLSLFVAPGAGDTVYVSGCRDGRTGPMVAVSDDGGQSFSPWRLVADHADPGMEAEYRSRQVCMVAADETDGPHRGNVYLAYMATADPEEAEDRDRDIFFVRSEDGGETWSDPLQLNLDGGGGPNSTADQFFPAISVNPDGVVDVVWYDRRHDPEDGRLLDLYHRYSRDGGRTWSDELRVTEVSSDPRYSIHQGGFVFIGDYIDIDSSAECAWPAWVDTRHGKADVATACIERPGTAVEAGPAP